MANQSSFPSDDDYYGNYDNLSISDWECLMDSLLDKPPTKLILCVLHIVIFVASFSGNLTVLLVVVCHAEMRNATNCFLANLAIAGILVSVFCMVQNAMYLYMTATPHWVLGRFMCHMYIFGQQFWPSVSAGILVLLSMERYIAVINPFGLKFLLTKLRLLLFTLLTWLVCLSASAPYFDSALYHTFGNTTSCSLTPIDLSFKRSKVTVNFVLWYLIPVCAMIYMYSMISYTLSIPYRLVIDDPAKAANQSDSEMIEDNDSRLKHAAFDDCKRNDSGKTVIELRSHRRSTHKKLFAKQTDQKKKIVRLLVAIVVNFAFLSLPHHLR